MSKIKAINNQTKLQQQKSNNFPFLGKENFTRKWSDYYLKSKVNQLN